MRRAVSVFTSENTPKHPVVVLCLPSSKTDVCDFLCFHVLLGKIGTIFTPRAEVTNIRPALPLKLLRLEQRSAGSLSALVNKVLLEYSYYVLSGCLCTTRAELSSCSTDCMAYKA